MKELVVFSAKWCGQCGPFKQALMKDGIEFKTVDVEENEADISKYSIRSLPTSIVFEDGVEVSRVVGNRVKKVKEALE